MDKIVVRGGRPLEGTIDAAGSKNAALPILTAAILAPGAYRFTNVPLLRDVTTMARLLETLGARFHQEGHELHLDTTGVESIEAPYDLVKTMRASVYVLGPLLARFGSARVSLPGGCAWGPRPIDLHLMGMKALGAEVTLEEGYVVAHAEKLTGADIDLGIASVGATGNILMAAVSARGTTRIRNAAREPEIPALAEFLNAMGARISGAGTGEIVIEGGAPLKPAPARIIPDRIEVGTYLIAGAMTGGDVTLTGCRVDHIAALLGRLVEIGARIEERDGNIRVRGPARVGAFVLKTDYYPGFPTDLQAQMMAMAAVASGRSVLTDTVYTDRFTHVAELQRLGADIQMEGNMAVINGIERLSGAQVMATDLRASAALILAGLVAEGETHVSRVYHIDRGYERIEERLTKLGADIRRETESGP
ncbi:MAG: UDP-N-acetylglucosamine 1-carboxyvinyltransferase [Candidatus Eisenbacteria bacterium]|nr:UDP-N-acetylglucosamine 1-carboxyvinyltransferase [Candidatus Eisenbacteria bacterium]